MHNNATTTGGAVVRADGSVPAAARKHPFASRANIEQRLHEYVLHMGGFHVLCYDNGHLNVEKVII